MNPSLLPSRVAAMLLIATSLAACSSDEPSSHERYGDIQVGPLNNPVE